IGRDGDLRHGLAVAAAEGWQQGCRSPTGGVNSAQPKVGGGLPTFGVLLAGANPATQARRKSAPLWHTCTAVHMGSDDWLRAVSCRRLATAQPMASRVVHGYRQARALWTDCGGYV